MPFIGYCMGRLCLTDADCSLYGSSCDVGTRFNPLHYFHHVYFLFLVRHQCRCNINCKKFQGTGLVCQGTKRQPIRACEALSMACEQQESVPVRNFNVIEYISNKRRCPISSMFALKYILSWYYRIEC